jgi:dTDP-4-amino-4,6-dideoxygalactose transaminase
MKKIINVTQPFLPPLKEFLPLLNEIWDSKILTNAGPFHQKFEKELTNYLNIKNISLFSNGTIAIISALQALRITGDVITTPYSFVATSHALLWNNINPIFVDIDPSTFNIDPNKIEAAITPQTTAILAVHCYGNPCDTEKIQKIADDYNLKVIYDAAHAFGVNCDCDSLLSHGDLSILSFHATKVFNTFEGGAIVSNDLKVKKRIDQLKNFGFVDETTVVASGINGKMNEFASALGLLQLKYMDHIISTRKIIDSLYREKLNSIKGLIINKNLSANSNYAYFPILVGADFKMTRDEVFLKMQSHGINARRYFYPLISEFPMYRSMKSANPDNLVNAKIISEQIICLPIYPDLDIDTVNFICDLITG